VICRPLTAITVQRLIIRVKMTGIKDKTPSEILTEAKKNISEAYTMKPLCSGDIDIIISN
jgi:hypothetical protein